MLALFRARIEPALRSIIFCPESWWSRDVRFSAAQIPRNYAATTFWSEKFAS
jgi:hypothetical protein